MLIHTIFVQPDAEPCKRHRGIHVHNADGTGATHIWATHAKPMIQDTWRRNTLSLRSTLGRLGQPSLVLAPIAVALTVRVQNFNGM